jgi:hypothetical protein
LIQFGKRIEQTKEAEEAKKALSSTKDSLQEHQHTHPDAVLFVCVCVRLI